MTRRDGIGRAPVLALFIVATASGCGGGLVAQRDEGQVIVTEPEKVSTAGAASTPAPRATTETTSGQPTP